ncbi:hypothetical protein C8R43DRAFT_1129260 [Mycena crocata]|nr:hypothetical protein C8R43DRAFT_1129260 [Mycena crocata]
MSTSQLPTFGFETTAEEVATVFSDEIKGKNVLITGTSLQGIGFSAALAIAKHANLVIITGYNDERLKLSEEAIKKELPSANIRRLNLDLSSLSAVRKAAAEVNAYSEPIHVLINNAAAPIAPYKSTADGYDLQLATGQLGPFLFTKLIAPKILATKTASYTPRVVIVASAAHGLGDGFGVDLAYLEKPEADKYNLFQLYQQTKSSNILFAKELSKRAKGALNVYSLHPGVILTNLNLKPEANGLLKAFGSVDQDGATNDKNGKWKTISQGGATTVVAAFDPRLNDKSGAYLDDGVVADESVAAHSSDPVTAEKLWALTEKIVGEKFVL